MSNQMKLVSKDQKGVATESEQRTEAKDFLGWEKVLYYLHVRSYSLLCCQNTVVLTHNLHTLYMKKWLSRIIVSSNPMNC